MAILRHAKNGAKILVWVSIVSGVLGIVVLLFTVSYKVFAKDAAQDVTIATQGQQIEHNTDTLKEVTKTQGENHKDQMKILKDILAKP